MYSNSVVTGDWESYVARDLVEYIDAHYRTIAAPASRGLAGHSMGGYGVMRIGMKHPEVFSVLYAMSPCCMIPNMTPQAPPAAARAAGAARGEGPPQERAGQARGGRGADNGLTVEQVRTFADVDGAGFGVKAQLASAAAWSPNPKNPPFYIDLPTRDGQTDPVVLAKWAANAPLAMADQYIGNLKKLKAIAVDAGDRDEPIAGTVRTMHDIFQRYGLVHTFEIYQGDHVNRIADRMTKNVLPFFSANLSYERGRAGATR
jgi:S-formylglutathione hydrolase FrmB